MGYIKKLKNNELVGGTDKHTIYPVTSTEAVFEEITEGSESNFKSQKFLNNNITGDRINEGTITDYNIAVGTVTKGKLSPQVQTMLDEGQKKALTPKGNYNPETEYEALDLVFDPITNSSYISLQTPNVGHPVDENAEGYEEGWWEKTLDGTAVNTAQAAINNKVDQLDAQVDDAIGQAQQDIQDLINETAGALQEATDAANGAAAEASAVVADKVAGAQVGYYTSTTTAATAIKQTTTDTIGEDSYAIPYSGGAVKIKMEYANTSTDTVYLQFGTNTATKKPLYYNGETASASNSWEDGEIISVYYDNTVTAGNEVGVYQATNVQGGGGDGAFNISKYKALNGVPATFRTFAEALGTNGVNVPGSKRKGGMTIKYIQLTDGTYSIVKTEGLETQPSGTEVEEAIDIADGTYTAAQLEGIETLPSNVGNSVTYYLAVTEDIEVEPETEGEEPTTETVTTYTTWVITKLTDDSTQYVQWVLKNTQWSIDEKDWAGIDIELGEDKTGTPATKAVSEYVQLREDVVAAALCDLHKNLTVLPDDIMRYNSRKKKILVFGSSIEANARSGSGWDVNDPRGWLYWLNKAPYVDTIYNFANGSSCLTSRMTSTYSPSYRTKDNTINIYWNQIIHALQRYLAGAIETPDVVLISSGGNDIQWNSNSRGSIFNDTADEVFSANMNDFNFSGYTDEQVINGDFPDDGADIAEMRVQMLSIAKAVRYISEMVYTYWPETQIIWMGNMYTRGGDIPRANVENRFNEFIDKIESCCVKMSIPCIRSDKESGRWMIYEMKKHIEAGGSASDDYNQGKAHAWGFTQDGYHPTVKGAEMFGRYMINKLASVLRY